MKNKLNKKKLTIFSVVLLIAVIFALPFIQSMIDARKTSKLTPQEFMQERQDR